VKKYSVACPWLLVDTINYDVDPIGDVEDEDYLRKMLAKVNIFQVDQHAITKVKKYHVILPFKRVVV
jgi:hypothetical protein